MQQRVAVGRRRSHRLRADDLRAARAVVDDERGIQVGRGTVRPGASHEVAGAARRRRHNQADQPRGPRWPLRLGHHWQRSKSAQPSGGHDAAPKKFRTFH